MKKASIYGFGIMDIKHTTQTESRDKETGRRVVTFRCPIYSRWYDMIRRCYNPRSLKKNPSYTGCSVAPEWRYFSAFKEWYIEYEEKYGSVKNLQLDKDILSSGARVYSPDTCCFVSKDINGFISLKRSHKKSDMPIGVGRHKNCIGRIYYAGRINAPWEPKKSGNKRAKVIRYRDTIAEAYTDYVDKKIEIAHYYEKELPTNRIRDAFLALIYSLKDEEYYIGDTSRLNVIRNT